MLRFLLTTILTLGGLASLAPAQTKPTAKTTPPGQRVFFASHSLMWYAPTPLGEMAEAAGIKDHKLIGLQSLGASKTLQHWNLPDDKNEAKKALKAGNVDVFVMSPISFPDEGIENFVKLGLEHNPNMRFIVQLSWGGGDIDNQDFPKGAFDNVDKEKTPDQLKALYERNIKSGEAQADDLNKKYGKGKKIVALVPSAQAMVALRTKIANKEWPGLSKQGELFVDAVHPSAPMESLNTYMHFAVLYGQSPVGLPMPIMLKNTKREAWDEKFNRSLQELAWETVTNYPYSLVTKTFTNSIGMKFVWIQPGTFMMGTSKEQRNRFPSIFYGSETEHKVTLTKGFYMSVYPVTQEQWKEVMGNNPSQFKGEKNLPVERVSWNDCQDFIESLRKKEQRKIAYRLPTEAEFEYACRAGTTTLYYFGDGISTKQANYDAILDVDNEQKGVIRSKTTPVDAFPANAWGLHDMQGNVWQWCNDWYGDYTNDDVTDPQGPKDGEHRVMRGGSWYSSPRDCRSANRSHMPPVARDRHFGFRICYFED